jgi:hypothetical protein
MQFTQSDSRWLDAERFSLARVCMQAFLFKKGLFALWRRVGLSAAMSSFFAQLRARLGAARMMLGRVPEGPRHMAASTLQSTAVVELLSQEACRRDLSSDERAQLGDQLVDAKFEIADEALILAALNTGISKPGRRKAQDGMAFLYYISGHEWHNPIPVA